MEPENSSCPRKADGKVGVGLFAFLASVVFAVGAMMGLRRSYLILPGVYLHVTEVTRDHWICAVCSVVLLLVSGCLFWGAYSLSSRTLAEDAARSFHSSAKATLLCVIPVSIILGVAQKWLLSGYDYDWRGLAFGLAAAVVVLATLAPLLCRWWKMEVNDTGISVQSFLSRRRSLEWTEIVAARPFRFITLPYLRLYGRSSKKPLWIALFLQNPEAFRDSVKRCAPPGNPILDHLVVPPKVI